MPLTTRNQALFMTRLEILLCSLYAPYPPYDGGATRTLELLKPLGAKHSVTLLGTYDPEKQTAREVEQHLSSFCRRVELVPHPVSMGTGSPRELLRGLVTYPPPRITKFLDQAYVRKAGELVEQSPDLVICNSILVGQFWRRPSRRCSLLDLVDRMELLRRREVEQVGKKGLTWFSRYVDWRKTTLYERQVWARFDSLVAITEADRRLLERLFPAKRIALVPTGVHPPEQPVDLAMPKRYDLLMVANWSYPPNVDALDYFDRAVMPWLLERMPQLRVAIVGKNLSAGVQALAQSRGSYDVFENVPDVSPFYEASRVAIIPMRLGSGIKLKLLEALAYGVPVVTTPAGADGVPVEHEREVLIAGDAAQFACQVLRVLHEPGLGKRLARAGRELIEQRYTWSRVQELYLDAVERAASGAGHER